MKGSKQTVAGIYKIILTLSFAQMFSGMKVSVHGHPDLSSPWVIHHQVLQIK